MADEIHERICQMQAEHPDRFKEEEPRVIYLTYKPFFTAKCSYMDCIEGDCQHLLGWHSIPYRVVKHWIQYHFEVMRRCPNKEPGSVWTPMTAKERQWIERQWIADRLAQLSRDPEVESIKDA